MNKKFLFAAMSLAMLTACSTDDIESQKVAQEASAIQFEFVNNNDATRASMNGNNNNALVWSARDNDLLTLYHGAAALGDVTGYQNATYSIKEGGEGETATLTTPTMILQGAAIMVWPADTTFRIGSGANLSVVIPTEQSDIANQIPFVSDQIEIGAYGEYNEDPAEGPVTAWNTAGWNRKYPVYMRPMASQLNIKAIYAGTDETIAELYTGDDPIDEIAVESIDLLTNAGGATPFSTELPIAFTAENAAWAALDADVHQAWKRVTTVNRDAAIQTAGKLTTTFLNGNDGGKFIILPQPIIGVDGVVDAAVVVNTIYGKVVVANPGVADTKYSAVEAGDAWYRLVGAATVIDYADNNETKSATPEADGKYKVTADIAHGMKQTINFFGDYTAPATNQYVKGEPMGTPITRYVKVLLTHLDMSDLHVKTDKQLRDVAKVWKKMGLDPVTVYLDGGAAEKFTITQKTIDVINSVNPTGDVEPDFKVKPCQDATHGVCKQIVITENSDNAAVKDVDFIAPGDGGETVEVVFADETTAWNWAGDVKVDETAVSKFINLGTMANAETKTLRTLNYAGTQNYVSLQNDGTWNVTAGTLNVQISVTNNGTVNIKKGAQYRQDGATTTIFYNYATNKPTRFGGDDAKIGVVNNGGVFATVANGRIYNYGLIEHGLYPDEDYNSDAKTYITRNEIAGTSDFGSLFSGSNKMGRINLPWGNKDEDNISVSSALDEGFISVTVTSADAPTDGILNADVVGAKVNYVIVNSGIKEIAAISDQVKYLEINDPTKMEPNEIAWNVTSPTTYDGLMILSDVNIKLGTTITVSKATYLGADMYVGGTFTTASWNGYYGATSTNVATKYITY